MVCLINKYTFESCANCGNIFKGIRYSHPKKVNGQSI